MDDSNYQSFTGETHVGQCFCDLWEKGQGDKNSFSEPASSGG